MNCYQEYKLPQTTDKLIDAMASALSHDYGPKTLETGVPILRTDPALRIVFFAHGLGQIEIHGFEGPIIAIVDLGKID